jgi:UTP--glucose-1-phosphate uridylyltransferase
MKPLRKAIFPVAGLGTRFLPATKAIPKEMLPVVDKPLIQYAVEEARAAGVEEFIFVTGRGKSALEDHFDHAFELNDTLRRRTKQAELAAAIEMVVPPGQVVSVRQQEPKGLGHAVWCARNMIAEDEPVAVLLADDLVLADTPCLAQMAEAHQQVGGNVIAVMDVPREHTARYGVLSPGRESGRLIEVRGLVEKPKPADAPSTLAVIGRYILEPKVFAMLDRQDIGAGGEIQLTDAMARLIGGGPFHGYRIEGERFDCGDKAGFLEANLAFALRHPELGTVMRRILDKYAAQDRKMAAETGQPRKAGTRQQR